MKKTNILIVGVGGQGTLLASVLLGNLALLKGYDVKLSEVHGMAQRGGSVVTHVKISEGTVNSPLIEEGDADVIIAFEELEAYRWLPYLKKGGTMYVNTQQILPMPVIMGQA
ncbi:MAG: indolepyruvate oxidoreductase subunit beta, partial [Anaerovoracaceae bacterium]